MRTLVATILQNSKKKDIYCTAKKVSPRDIEQIKDLSRPELEELGFEFIRILSLEYPDVRGYVLFYNGHLDEMSRALRQLNKQYNGGEIF